MLVVLEVVNEEDEQALRDLEPENQREYEDVSEALIRKHFKKVNECFKKAHKIASKRSEPKIKRVAATRKRKTTFAERLAAAAKRRKVGFPPQVSTPAVVAPVGAAETETSTRTITTRRPPLGPPQVWDNVKCTLIVVILSDPRGIIKLTSGLLT